MLGKQNSFFPELRAAIEEANPWLLPWWERIVQDRGWRNLGWVTRGKHEQEVVLCPAACTLPGRGYSWPGSVSDRTVRGVYLHEIGHVAHASLPNERAVLQELRDLGGPRVTSYEPNAKETFAETFRLFAGNPALLREGRPWRYEFLLRHGVKPLAGMPRAWERGLIGKAPQRFYDQCERWIARGKLRRCTSVST